MAGTTRGLGRGLDALLKGFNDHRKDGEIRLIPLDAIEPNPHQPRKTFSDESLEELAESIRSQGVLQPVLVRPLDVDDEGEATRFELVAGERRWRAAGLAKIKLIPSLVRDLTDQDSLVVALIENLQREDLNPLEEAQGLKRLQDELSLNQEALAQKVGKSRPGVANLLRLLQLPESVQQDVKQGALSAGHARALLGVDDAEVQTALRDRILAEGLSVRQVESMVAHYKEHDELPDGAVAGFKPSPPPSGKRAPMDPHLKDLQRKLSKELSLKVRVNGTPEKGKVVVNFSSPDQLQGLLDRLGLSG